MSMSTHIIGFQPPDNEWKKKKDAYNACIDAEIPIPKELDLYFNGEAPDDYGGEISIDNAVTKWCEEMRDGFEVEIAKLSPNVKIIRFYNSY